MPLGDRDDYGDAKYVGLELGGVASLAESLKTHGQQGFDFVLAPLAGERATRAPDLHPGVPHLPPSYESDLSLSSSSWTTHVVGVISDWIDLDSEDAELRARSAEALTTEVNWAHHLSLNAVVVPGPRAGRHANLAQRLSQLVRSVHSTSVWVRYRLTHGDASCKEALSSWLSLKALCEHNKRLGVTLEIQRETVSEGVRAAWAGEPVKAVIVTDDAFLTNNQGFPVLPKAHQGLLESAFRHGVQVVLQPSASGAVVVEGDEVLDHSSKLKHKFEYLSFLFRRMPTPDGLELASMGYRDYLQIPLQPLQDNLESCTYETFERDAIKYSSYESAMALAFQDMAVARGGVKGAAEVTLQVMVVGAGRGPLVRAALSASSSTGINVVVWAVEKNANAFVTLRHLTKIGGWGERVNLVFGDMRTWEAPVKADVMVSELLGSFGCNELSPECLDGAQEYLAEGGICIPQKYTNYLQPVATSKVFQDLSDIGDRKHFETPAVVKLHRFYPLGLAAEGMTFSHPNRTPCPDNMRELHLSFARGADDPPSTVHGLAGYFRTWLYQDVMLSTHPEDHTPGMYSWFPIFFPLQHPVRVDPGASIEVHMWRCVDKHKVWYEWALTGPQTTHLHNAKGRSFVVGL